VDTIKNYVLPETDVHWNDVKSYVERIPQDDYRHAPESAVEAFNDIKFGVRIHWGLYSMLNLLEESWPFLKMSYEDRQNYQELYKRFDPQGFDAGEWMRLFKKAGINCVAFTSKHHDGFSMFDTKTRVKRRANWTTPGAPQIEECDIAYSVMDSPFKRDIVRELCDAAREQGIKMDLYFSHPDWYDADFRPYTYHPLTVPEYEKLLTGHEIKDIGFRFDKMDPFMTRSLTDDEKTRMLERHRQQLVEILENYDPDMLCLDMWLGSDVWPQLRETIKVLRDIKPDVMLRARGIGNYGDYYTPEGFIPGSKDNTDMPWMVIYPLAKGFSYDPDESRYKGGAWIINNLVDCVAKGGSFMVGIGPDMNGSWHPKAVEQLEEAGKWLEINGEAIYNTRPRPVDLYKENDDVYFTRSKDSGTVYAICMKWPGKRLDIKSVCPVKDANVRLLGYDQPLEWEYGGNGLSVMLPDHLQNEDNRPCKTAYSFKIPVK